jgi:transaldolase
MHPVRRLLELGQSAWLDFLDHQIVTSGELRRMIEEGGLRGVTSNPTIFQKAIAASRDYDDLVRAAPPRDSDRAIFERICVRDIQLACDQLRATYDAAAGADGFVSIEVAPALAHDTRGSIDEARRLWSEVSRPNVMVKIPGTREGLPAIERCLDEGININVTLLFGIERYSEVADAYLEALEARVARGAPIERVASIASFFVSRVDTKVDRALDATKDPRARVLRGGAGIANAKLAFERYERIFASERAQRLLARSARRQRVLWGSTSPKDPLYPDLYYAEALIGPGTVDTMTKETFRAYLDHGRPEARLGEAPDEARAHLAGLAELGIDFARVTQELEDEGVRAFAASYDKALAAIADKRSRAPEAVAK